MNDTWPSYRNHHLPAFTLRAIRAIPKKSRVVVVLTTGAIEQHGPHLPVGVDALLGQAYLDRAIPLASQSCPVYTMPPIQVAKSNEHSGYPGTLILHRENLRQQILASGRQVADWGFGKLAILNTHGGNTSVIKSCLRELRPALDARLLAFPYECECPPRETRYGIHAGELETSLMLALTPDLVRAEASDCCWIGPSDDSSGLQPECSPATYAWQTSDLSPTGTMGDATRATEEKGHLWIERASQAIADAILEFSQSPA